MRVSLNLIFSSFLLLVSSAAFACDEGKEWEVRITNQSDGTVVKHPVGEKFEVEGVNTVCETLIPQDVIGNRLFSDPSLRAFSKVESLGMVCQLGNEKYMSFVATYFRPKGEIRGVTNKVSFVLGSVLGKKNNFGFELSCVKKL